MAMSPKKITLVQHNIPLQKLLLTLILLVGILLLVINSKYVRYPSHFVQSRDASENISSTSESPNETLKINLLLDSPHCQIPDFDPWDPETVSFYNKTNDPKCSKHVPRWSTIDHNSNELVLQGPLRGEDGLIAKNYKCCYKVVSRTSKDARKVDNAVDISACKSLGAARTKISEEFIVVECSSTNKTVIYRMFHALILSSLADVDRQNGQTQARNADLPPNVLILGIDSTSRLNMMRHMKETISTLQSIGAVQMNVYNKVAEGTYVNFCALLTGYLTDKLRRICVANATVDFHDSCPFIWGHFEKAGYLTGHLEDGETFTYRRAGFNKQPVDFYIRPLFLAAFKYQSRKQKYFKRCAGYLKTTELNLEYVQASLDFGRRHDKPIFNFFWNGITPHDDYSGIRTEDGIYANYILSLSQNGYLNNTILFVMSDHGYRYGAIRETTLGYFEDKLPALWIYLPPGISKLKPEWKEALEYNAKRLISPYGFYWTMHLILKEFSPATYKPPEDSRDSTTGDLIHRVFKHSFFERVPHYNCDDLGIPRQFCACDKQEKLPLGDDLLVKAANNSIQYINDFLIDKEKCVPLSISKITSGAIRHQSVKTDVVRYLTIFTAEPGGGMFETEINCDIKNQTFSSENISVQRINKMNMDYVKCIEDSEVELYCFCK